MKTASLTAGLLARKGSAEPAANVQPLYPHVQGQQNWIKKLLENSPATNKRAGIKNPLTGRTKRVHKGLYLTNEDHHRLRLLAARTGCSQQYLMEQAVTLLLQEAQKESTCICGSPRR